MDRESIVALRRELSCTQRELAATLGVEPKVVQSWESGESFPTKKTVATLDALRRKGHSAVVRKPRSLTPISGVALLEDPRLWAVVRKLVERPDLLAQVVKLVETHPGGTDREKA